MFYNTIGGHYERRGKMVSYVFPENAYVEISECRIPIGNLKVECHAEGYDDVSIKHFSDVISLVQPAENKIYNSSIYINDCHISAYGYPGKEDFKKYGVEYISPPEFDNLESQAIEKKLPPGHSLCRRLDEVKNLFKRKADDNCKVIVSKIERILKGDKSFPKKVSIIYDNRVQRHVSHIVLEFYSMKQCVLHIENTISSLIALYPSHLLAQLMEDFKISLDDIEEEIPEDKMRAHFIDVYKINTNKPLFSVQLSAPINEILINAVYKRMILMIKSLGFSISNVIMYHRYNQKDSLECVPFACQNKLTYITQSTMLVDELVLHRGARIRAQHAILTYLLKGMDHIPRYSDDVTKQYGYAYDEKYKESGYTYTAEEWYPNFSDVCSQLNDSIQQMPFNELSKLYLSLDLDGVTKLSDKFKPLILMAMKLKVPLEEYESISFDREILPFHAVIFQNTYAPSAFYNGVTQTVNISKTWAKQMISQEQNVEDQNMDGLVRKMSALLIS